MSLLGPNLEAFMAIVKYGTVYGAAEEVSITQTAVTQRIRSLEKMLQTTLFRRTRRGMMLTQEGETLMHYCKITHDFANETLEKIQGTGINAEIRISITGYTSIMSTRIIPQCIPVLKKFHQLLFDFKIDDTPQKKLTLKSGKCDFAILDPDQLMPEMKYKELLPEHYLLMGPYEWRNRELKDIIKNERIIDFNEADQVTYDDLKHFKLFKIANHRRHYASRIGDLVNLVSAGLGYSAISKTVIEPMIKNKKLALLNEGKSYDKYPVLAWYDRPVPPEYFSAIIEAIK